MKWVLWLVSAVAVFGCDDTIGGKGSGDGGPGGGRDDVAACAVFFTELLPDPKTDDGENEFVEIYNPGPRGVSLDGCRLELQQGPEGDTKRHEIAGLGEIPAGEFRMLGPEDAMNVHYNWRTIPNLPNSSSKGKHTLSVVCGATVVTSVSYLAAGEGGFGPPTVGRSWQLDSNALTCEAAADLGSWCLSPDEVASGENFETRGAANAACPAPPPPCGVSSCGLFFTEVLADPTTDDSNNEYLEIFNPGADPVELRGCDLELQKGESEAKVHRIAGDMPVIAQAGGFVLLGPEEAVGTDYRWTDLGDLPNSSSTGAVTLRLRNPADGAVIDSFTYLVEGGALDRPARGASFQLCSDTGFSCEGNDDPANWSVADIQEEDGENLGTRRGQNRPCVALTCVETACDGTLGAERRVAAPGAGDVVISEVFANPLQSPEGSYEWVELYNPTDRDIDLNGVEFWRKETNESADHVVGNGVSCVTLPAGERRVFAATDNVLENGGLDICAGFSHDKDYSLVNSNGYMSLRLGETIIDEVRWASAPEARSLELSPACDATAAANDDPACWCPSKRPATQPPEELTFHTAGDANEACDACYCTLPDQSWQRVGNLFAAGDIEITEYMSNVPGSESDRWGWEFVELRAATGGHLNCGSLRVGDDDKEFPWTECYEMGANEHVALFASADPEQNGGVSNDHVREIGRLNLRGGEGRLAVVLGGQEVAVVDNYADYGDGVAGQRDPNNGAFCAATAQYSPEPDPAFGTPGAANNACE